MVNRVKTAAPLVCRARVLPGPGANERTACQGTPVQDFLSREWCKLKLLASANSVVVLTLDDKDYKTKIVKWS